MPIDDRLKALIAGFIEVDRHLRDQQFRKLLRSEQAKAAERGSLGAGFYGQAQDERCAEELRTRGERWLATVVRVFSETGEQWTEELARDVGWLLAQELEVDARQLESELDGVTAPHGPRLVGGLLSTAKERTRTALVQEIALFVLKRERFRVPLLEMLSPPRYSAAQAAWRKAREFLDSSPPDFEKAVSEALQAVEAIARIVVGDPKPTLGDCIKVLRQRGIIDAPLLKGFEEIWGIASEAENVRHGGGGGMKLSPDIARYVVTLSDASLRLLLSQDVT